VQTGPASAERRKDDINIAYGLDSLVVMRQADSDISICSVARRNEVRLQVAGESAC
jgi:hypothetical protein